MTDRRGRALILLLLFLSLAFRHPLLYLLVVLALIVAGASALWGRYCLAGVSYTRRFGHRRLFCGEETDLWIEIANAKPLPLAWLKVEDELPIEFQPRQFKLSRASQPNRRLLTNLLSVRWYELVRRHYRVMASRRGAFEFGPVVMSSGDIFGFRTRFLDLDQRERILVYPKIAPLADLDLRPARPFGEFRAARRISEDPLRLAAVRDFQPGDTLRQIHWKATARRARLQSKTYEPDASHHLVLFLNCHVLGQVMMSDVFETAVTVAASLAHAGLEARRAVGLFANGGALDSERRVRVPASRHTSQPLRLLETLAQLTYFTFLPFDALLRAEAPQLPYGATVIAVTADVDEAILTQLLDLRAAGHPAAAIVIGQPAVPLAPPELPLYFVTKSWDEIQSIDFQSAPAAAAGGAGGRPG